MADRETKIGILLGTRGLVMAAKREGRPANADVMLELAERVDEAGLDSVWVGDSLVSKPRLEPVAAMSAIAARTSHVRIGTAVMLPAIRHAVPLAHALATADVLSHGRIVVGAGVGGAFTPSQAQDWIAAGVDPKTRAGRFTELVQVMKRLWTEEKVGHHGEFFDFEDVTLAPFPAQKPHPPMWVAGRSEAAMRRAALLGDGWYPYLFTVRRLKASKETIEGFAAEAGRDLTGFHWGLNQPTSLGNDRAEAFAVAVANVGQRYVTAQRSAEDIAQSLCVSGNPQDCIKAIEERVEAGVRDFNFGFLTPDAPGLFKQMELFSSQVMPYFKS